MTRARSIITSIFFSLSVLALSPASLPTQAFANDTYKADAAILSAGSRAAAISRLKSVPSVGVVNLNIRYMSRFRDDAHDVTAFKISAGKNFSGSGDCALPLPQSGNPPRLVSPWNFSKPGRRCGYLFQRLN